MSFVVVNQYRAARKGKHIVISATWPDEPMSPEDFLSWFRRQLHRKITHLEAPDRMDRKRHDTYTQNLYRDRRVIQNYINLRHRSTGSRNLLRTPELQAKYPHINTQVAEGH